MAQIDEKLIIEILKGNESAMEILVIGVMPMDEEGIRVSRRTGNTTGRPRAR
ncbi:hypothetical protein [Metaclostridioides mangenotii]|uniref:hypothetical protein n=1 Tax=Metaclostridioides mangenotii TaxID=1540 RepID=UPI0004B2FA5D|nr:hypothetical protein [Clostridioides mangenotii]